MNYGYSPSSLTGHDRPHYIGDTRICKICKLYKPYDRGAKPSSKKSGFLGSKCWNCYLTHAAQSTRKSRRRNLGCATESVSWYRFNKIRKYIVPWSNRQEIRKVYAKAKQYGLCVDHIVPLTHPLVCGLHITVNLQLLTKSENSRKGNIFISDWGNS